jgi:hypothetical protein
MVTRPLVHRHQHLRDTTSFVFAAMDACVHGISVLATEPVSLMAPLRSTNLSFKYCHAGDAMICHPI